MEGINLLKNIVVAVVSLGAAVAVLWLFIRILRLASWRRRALPECPKCKTNAEVQAQSSQVIFICKACGKIFGVDHSSSG